MLAKIILSNSVFSIQNAISMELIKIGINKNSPDLLYFDKDEKLGIEEARRIKGFLSMKAYNGKGKAVVLENGENLTTEAQNGLLKSLEELSPDDYFLIGAAREDTFLPTILSRCEVIRVKSQKSKVKSRAEIQDIEKLLNSTIGERFEYIEKLKDKEGFLNDLVFYLHLRGGNVNLLKEILQAEQWQKQNVNIRAILEYLMLVIPSKL